MSEVEEFEDLSPKEILLLVLADLNGAIEKNQKEADSIKHNPHRKDRFNFVWGKIKEAQYTRDHIIKKYKSILGMPDLSMKCPLSNYQRDCKYGYPSRTKCFRCTNI